MSSSYDSKPWYIKKNKQELDLLNRTMENKSFFTSFFNFILAFKKIFLLFSRSFFAFICVFLSAICFSKVFLISLPGKNALFFMSFAILFLFLSLYFFISQIGSVCLFFMERKHTYNPLLIGASYIQSKIEKVAPKKGLLAPEMILRQFLQQVRLYSSEKSYYNQKMMDTTIHPSSFIKNDTILKRRWNDIQDTIDEFDIYLANNPHDVITKLVTKSSQEAVDVSHIFREIAETVESTWRAKGVNIEHAIVVPLKANISDKLLKRLLCGPWRACAYLCAKGSGVVFAAKNEENRTVARWECEGVTFPNKFFELIKNQTLSVNDRIESGIELIANDPKNSNILFGLISLIIWHDLATASQVEFTISQGNEGMIIKLKL